MHFFDPAQQVHPPGSPWSPRQARTSTTSKQQQQQHTSAGTSSFNPAPKPSGGPLRSHSRHGRSPSTSRTSAYPAQASIIAAPHQSRSVSGSAANTSAKASSNVQVTHGNRPGEIYMPEGVVDMAAFGQILALDETDPTREFSKALVWAWCDQAELAVEEMELFLEAGEIVPMADKAHYLKGSSSSLGLLKVAQTCQSIYHIHFPPSLAHARAMSYVGNHGAQHRGHSDDATGSSGPGSSSGFSSFGASSSSSSSSSASPSPFVSSYASDSSASSVDQERSSSNESLDKGNSNGKPAPLGPLRRSSVDVPPVALARPKYSPRMDQQPSHYFQPRGASFGSGASSSAASGSASPATQARDTAAHFEQQKLERAKSRLELLKREIREASEWLYAYYLESDRFAGVQSA